MASAAESPVECNARLAAGSLNFSPQQPLIQRSEDTAEAEAATAEAKMKRDWISIVSLGNQNLMMRGEVFCDRNWLSDTTSAWR
jgi:hypothetical protein